MCPTKEALVKESLSSQGVTASDVTTVRGHLSFLEETLRVNPSYDVRTYRVSSLDISRPYMG